jgi:hypothetical protein
MLNKLLKSQQLGENMLDAIPSEVESWEERKKPDDANSGTRQAGATFAGGSVAKPAFRATRPLRTSIGERLKLLLGGSLR